MNEDQKVKLSGSKSPKPSPSKMPDNILPSKMPKDTKKSK